MDGADPTRVMARGGQVLERRSVLLVVDGRTRAPQDGQRPDHAFEMLRARLDADVLDRDDVEAHWLAAKAAHRLGWPAGLTLLAALRARRYRVVHCDAESYGIILSLLVAWTPLRTSVLFVGHWPTRRAKSFLLGTLRAHRGAAGIIVQSSAVRRRLLALGVPARKVHEVPLAVDTSFWSPGRAVWHGPRYVASAGVELRDYPTMVSAMRALPQAAARVAAASAYSRHGNSLDGLDLPANVERVECTTAELRDLYDTSEFVVVPLVENETSAGLTTIVEAMSMGKAVICTRTEGQSEAVTDRRRQLRCGQDQRGPVTHSQLNHLLSAGDVDLTGPTGLYVPAGDVAQLREAITYLWENPDVARELGARGRRVAVSLMSVASIRAMTVDLVRAATDAVPSSRTEENRSA